MSLEVLTVSSEGQVVIPEKIRRELLIGDGAKLAAYTSGDVIMLKKIDIPTKEDFRAMMDEAQAWAREAGYQESDVNELIRSVRKSKRA